MNGTYKYYDLTVTNPTVEVQKLEIDYLTDTLIVWVYMYDQNDGGVFPLPDWDDPKPVPATTTKAAIKGWAENYLQKFKI